MGKHTAAQRGWYRHSSLVFCTPPRVCHNLLINPGWSCWLYQRWWTFLLFLHPHQERSLFISLCSDHGGGKSKRKKRQLVYGHAHMTDGKQKLSCNMMRWCIAGTCYFAFQGPYWCQMMVILDVKGYISTSYSASWLFILLSTLKKIQF